VGIKELLHHYHGLSPAEQAAFAGMLRAHQLFNTQVWRVELARRSHLLDASPGTPIEKIELLLKSLEVG